MIIELKSSSVKAQILPKIGGRLVFFSNNNENILKSDKKLWDGSGKPAVEASSDFMPYNGAIVWLGPQSEWWTQQEVNAERKKEKAVWPPDPFLIYGEFSVIEQTDTSVSLKSPDSPVSGVSMIKKYELSKDGVLTCTASITNITDRPIQWDIWFNTRMDGYCKSYTFCQTQANCRIDTMQWEGAQSMPFEQNGGYICYKPSDPEPEFKSRSSKAFIHAEKTFMAGFTDNRLLLIEFEDKNINDIHPEQALVEIFCHTEHSPSNSLLELEYHSEYKSLQPNETLSATQRWTVHNYSGGTSTENQIETLKKLGY